MKRENRLERPICCLCGYQANDHILYQVPLSQPPQERIICLNCADDIKDLLAEHPDAQPDPDDR